MTINYFLQTDKEDFAQWLVEKTAIPKTFYDRSNGAIASSYLEAGKITPSGNGLTIDAVRKYHAVSDGVETITGNYTFADAIRFSWVRSGNGIRISVDCKINSQDISEYLQEILRSWPGGNLDYRAEGNTPNGELAPGHILKVESLPQLTDPVDRKIFEIVTGDPDINDDQLGLKLADFFPGEYPSGMSRQSTNVRRRKIEAMGYKVR